MTDSQNSARGGQPDVIGISPDLLQQIITSAISAASSSSPRDATSNTTTPMERATRPSIEMGMTDGTWEFFLGEWKMYKRTTGLNGSAIIDQLLYACSDDFRRDLFNMYGSTMYGMDEDTLLKCIKKLAVQDTNRLVNRSNLWNMKQERGQPITTYISKLRGQAAICDYSLKCIKCNKVNDYSQDIVTDQLIRGLANNDIQQELLAQGDTLRTHEQILQYIIGKQAGIRNQAFLVTSTSLLDVQSAYQRQKKNENYTKHVQIPSHEISGLGCTGCGSRLHGKGTEKPRKMYCPAIGKTCNKCYKSNHFASVCRSTKIVKPESGTNAMVSVQESKPSFFMPQVSDTLTYNHATEKIPHMEYNEKLGWIKTSPRPLPRIQVSVRLDCDMQKTFNKPCPFSVKERTVSAFPDTCAQTTAAGSELMSVLGIACGDLIETSHKIFAANQSEMGIIGAVFLNIQCGKHVSKQLCYISKNLQGLFLSEHACIQLGIVSPSFPQRSSRVCGVVPETSVEEENKAPCGCLKRTLPPPVPNNLPFEGTEENIDKLQKWILDTYKSSAFNVCPHQPLPLMQGPPLKIYIKPNVNPVAVHTPIPAPLHWENAIKADLEKDVALGVLKPVPIGTPTIWCSRAVYVP